MTDRVSHRNFSTFLLYFFAFLLLWEWLRPIEQLTKTDHIEVFILFLLIAFMGSFFKLNGIFLNSIKTMYTLVSIYSFYYTGGFFASEWWRQFYKDIKENIGRIASGNWFDLSPDFNTLLFFILLWLLAYLISYWLLNRQRIFLFFLLTVIYLAVLDTFTPYNANAAIVRTILSGFLVMGMLKFYRLLKQESMVKEHIFARKWMVPLVVMVAISTAIGIIAPKAAPLWPDPVPFIKSFNEKSSHDGTGGIAKIGYGTNDSRLGGPFVADKTPVFKVLASSRHYWQVESKDSYTGKGWVASISGADNLPFQLDFPTKETLKWLDINRWKFPLPPFPNHVPTTKENAQIFMDMNYPHVIYPSGLEEIIASRGTHFIYDQDLVKIYAFDEKQNPVALKNYRINFDVPKYRIPELTKITYKDIELIDLSRYTELPINLPARVKKLAEQITASKTNWYDKAKAIESYLKGPDFTYDQKNVAVPGKNDDYVDQFLFKTKRGYCDNFSTSMAVMLRTLGIPTRWVKGYSDGEFLEYSKSEPNMQFYQITNNNAHSWVEVYFPEQGWIPFEPTKSFSSNVQFTYDVKSSTSGGSQVPAPIPLKKPQQKLDDTVGKNDQKVKSTEKLSVSDRAKKFIKQNWLHFLSAIVFAGLVAAFLYKIRSKWYPYVLILRFRWSKSDEQLGKAYIVLLKQFERYGIKRKNGQTLRNYASYIDFFFSTNEMGHFTTRYEQFVYHQHLPKGSWGETRELWENLIKKTIT